MVKKYQRKAQTNFNRLWGIDARELCIQENTTPAAMHMRVYLYGTPYQRAKAPNIFEERTGRSCHELCERTGLNSGTLFSRFYQNGNPFYVLKRTGWGDTEYRAPISVIKRTGFWLHPNHPDYDTERARWIPYLTELDPNGELGLIEKYGDL